MYKNVKFFPNGVPPFSLFFITFSNRTNALDHKVENVFEQCVIRDRTSKAGSQVQGISTRVMANGTISVSYTHLDAYKRQALKL